MKVVSLVPQPRGVTTDTAIQLRELADQIEAGRCEDVIWCSVVDGNFQMKAWASLKDSLVMSTLLHDWSLRRYKE